MIFTVDDRDIAFLKSQWDALTSLCSSELSVKDGAFQILRETYSEAGRFYHNLSHIKLLLELLESFHPQLQDPGVIRYAIWFHDVVYDPKRNDNEEESARFAHDVLRKLYVDAETIRFVRQLILATKGHRGHSLAEDAKLFLDMDLAILGMHEEIYKNYSQAIRAEYSWVPELLYRRSRREILENFIRRKRIYATDEMKNRFEEQARKNIQAEMEMLGAL